MLKKILVILAMLYAAASFAAVDVNKATAAELDSVKASARPPPRTSSTSARRASSRAGKT